MAIVHQTMVENSTIRKQTKKRLNLTEICLKEKVIIWHFIVIDKFNLDPRVFPNQSLIREKPWDRGCDKLPPIQFDIPVA